MRLHPLHLQLMHSQQSGQQGSQPPPHRTTGGTWLGWKGHGLFILPWEQRGTRDTALDIWDPWILFIFLAVLMTPSPNKILLEKAEEQDHEFYF